MKRQSFEIRLNSVISFVFVAFCQPRILRYSARDVTDIFAISSVQVESPYVLKGGQSGQPFPRDSNDKDLGGHVG